MPTTALPLDLPTALKGEPIDYLHYCCYCGEPLAILDPIASPSIDALDDSSRTNVSPVKAQVARGLGIPVYRIANFGSPLSHAAVRTLGESDVTRMTEPELREFIDRIHDCENCRRNRTGRFAADGKAVPHAH